MKRAIPLLLIALLALLPCCAALAEAGQTFTTDYYTLTLPGDWVIDTSGQEDNSADFQLLGNLCSPDDPGLVIEAGLVHCPDMGGISNGYAVVFYAYTAGTDGDSLLPMSDADWAQVESILATFKPAG